MQLRLLDLVPPRVRNPYPTPKPEKESIVMKVGPRRNETYLSMAIMAIGKLASRTGSSSRAIITYLKANGYQFDNTKRSLHSMNRALKLGVSSGKLEKVKLSFKLTALAKHQSKAMEKMKAKHLREKEMARTKKAKETKKANKESTKESIEKEKPRKPIERKTKQVRSDHKSIYI
ncbi:hypothetical protein KR009_002674 [Drosophila setifemur]|nr:hypothetical protein KR009_002674 [Drosophila setifemur]